MSHFHNDHRHSARPIDAVARTLIRTDRHNRSGFRRAIDTGELIKITQGCYLPAAHLTEIPTLWERQHTILLARIAASYTALRPGDVYTRDTALALLDYPVLHPGSDVHVQSLTAQRNGRLFFPEVLLPASSADQGVHVPAGRLIRHTGSPADFSQATVCGMPIVSLPQLICDLARFTPARDALANISMLLHEASAFGRFFYEEALDRAHILRAEALRALEDLPRGKGRQRAITLVSHARPECESIAEGALVWTLLACGLREWEQQLPLLSAGRRYYADFAFPQHRIIVEVEGLAKLKDAQGSTQARHQALLNRSSDLARQGWRVLHLSAKEVLEFPSQTTGKLHRFAPALFPPLSEPPSWLL